MRGAETVEEVQEGNRRLDGGQVGYTREVHNLLHGAFGQHGEAGLAAGHHILVVTEDAQGVRGNGARRHVEHRGELLAGDFVHIGNHQQQTLRCSVGCGESTCHQRAVHGACGTALRLHFLHQYGLAEDVLASCGGPFVHELGHCRGGGDGIDCGNLREHVGDVGRSLVSVTGQKLFFFAHN